MATISSSRQQVNPLTTDSTQEKRRAGYEHYLRNTVGNVRGDCCVGRREQCYRLLADLATSTNPEPCFGTPIIPDDLHERAESLGIRVRVVPKFSGKYQVVRVRKHEEVPSVELRLVLVNEPQGSWECVGMGDDVVYVNLAAPRIDPHEFLACVEGMRKAFRFSRHS